MAGSTRPPDPLPVPRRGRLGIPWVAAASLALLAASACSDDGASGASGSDTGGLPLPPGTSGTTAATPDDTTAATSDSTTGDDAPPLDSSSGEGPDPCLFCDAPNQQCIDDQCVTTCQGQEPDPCGPAQVCDVITGECHDPGDPCTLAGDSEPCGTESCGPGSVCDDQGSCIPVAPCADVVCLPDGACWGTFCACERASTCTPPAEVDLNGPFSVEISDLEFADDCTAWMVTLRSGTDYVRRLTPDGTLTEWGGVANLNMGEIKVLKALMPPPGIGHGRPGTEAAGTSAPSPAPSSGPNGPASDALAIPPQPGMEGLGEVAITYTCCSTCGCFVDPPQGVARLVESDPANPLPLVIESTITQGTGPFGATSADAGPFGLTWGIDRVLYVGNSTANGELVEADLELQTQAVVGNLPGRITASAPISAAHLLVAIEGGEVYRFNPITMASVLVADLGSDVTSLSHDAFDGSVYVGLRSLDVVVLDPWTGAVQPFATMPAIGRVTVSPDGQLWYSPVGYLVAQPLSAWDLPDTL